MNKKIETENELPVPEPITDALDKIDTLNEDAESDFKKLHDGVIWH